jgi:hypothetical protein
MSDERWVRVSAEQAEWLRIAAKRMAFDESLLASTAVLLEIVDAYERGSRRTFLGAVLGRSRPAPHLPSPAPITAHADALPARHPQPVKAAWEDGRADA